MCTLLQHRIETLLVPFFYKKMEGRIELAVGAMFSGKTSWVQGKARWSIIGGLKVIFMIPTCEDRYDKRALNVSHDGLKMEAVRVTTLVGQDTNVPIDTDVICIDEAHFMPGLAMFCCAQRELGRKVYVAGLSSDKDGKPWPEMTFLMMHANAIHVFEGVCLVCQQPALYSRDISGRERDTSGSVVDIGGDEKYASTCFTHFTGPIDPSVFARRAAAVNQARFLI